LAVNVVIMNPTPRIENPEGILNPDVRFYISYNLFLHYVLIIVKKNHLRNFFIIVLMIKNCLSWCKVREMSVFPLYLNRILNQTESVVIILTCQLCFHCIKLCSSCSNFYPVLHFSDIIFQVLRYH
jgi:hypothetical protein